MKLLIIVVTLALLCAPTNISAQSMLERIAKKTQQKLEQKTEQKIDDKIEKETDRQLDNIEKGVQNNDTSSAETDNIINRLPGMKTKSTPAQYSDSYSFSQSITMQMNTYNKKGELSFSSNLTLYYTPSEENFAYQLSNVSKQDKEMEAFSWFIIDSKNNSMLMLGETDGVKSGMATSISASSETGEKQSEQTKSINFTKTGRTKNIMGYTCHEYVGTDNKTTMEYWMTNQISWQSSGFMSNWQKKRTKTHINYPEGMMLEGNVTTENQERTHYLVTNINQNTSMKISPSQYQITNLGSITF